MVLRRATLKDAATLFDFRNEEETRKNSKQQEIIAWEDHLFWLAERLQEEESAIFLGKENGNTVGQIRLFVKNGTALISYSVDRQERHKGFGQALLQKIEEAAQKDNRILALEGEVKEDNKASAICFERLGYTKIKQENGMLLYRKLLEKRD